MENYTPMESEFGSLEHGIYKLIEVWTIYRNDSKYNLLWHNVTVKKSRDHSACDPLCYFYGMKSIVFSFFLFGFPLGIPYIPYIARICASPHFLGEGHKNSYGVIFILNIYWHDALIKSSENMTLRGENQ